MKNNSSNKSHGLRSMLNNFFDKNNTGKNSASSANSQDVVWYKRPLARKLGYLLVSVLVATTLWGYVLMIENPARTKRIEDIPVTFEAGSESDLDTRDLTICGNISEILPQVAVTIETTLNDLPRFNTERIDTIVKATVSMKGVFEAGEYTLAINATTSIGEIVKISPSTVTIKVDDLVERSIPVTPMLSGELPEGYWRNDPQLLTNSITIKGAKSEIVNIVKAGCIIDLNDRTESINDSMELTLYDRDDNIIPSSTVIGIVPSVTVKLDILPYIDIPVEPNIAGQMNMKDIYEIANMSIFPTALRVAGDAETLEGLSELITLEVVDVSNVSAEETLEYNVNVLGLPENVIPLNDTESFTVTIEIRERIEERTFESVPIRLINQDTLNYNYTCDTKVCDVTFRGKASIIRNLYSWQITLTLNLEGYEPGIHTLVPEIELLKPEYLEMLEVDLPAVSCNITELN